MEADTVDTFKRRLDKFCAGQNVVLDYKAQLKLCLYTGSSFPIRYINFKN